MPTINIEQSPPTTMQIVAARQRHAAILQVIAKRERRFRLIAVSVGLLGLSGIAWLWLTGQPSGVAAFVFARVVNTLSDAYAVAYAAIAGMVALAVALNFLLAKYIETPRDASTQCLAGLVDLEYSDNPDECIQFDAWRDQDETIKVYSNALVALNRKPVTAEYEAAKTWIESAGTRQLQANARAACDRMQQPIVAAG